MCQDSAQCGVHKRHFLTCVDLWVNPPELGWVCNSWVSVCWLPFLSLFSSFPQLYGFSLPVAMLCMVILTILE